jgi:membrane fusion protein (multidrug efflux system)
MPDRIQSEGREKQHDGEIDQEPALGESQPEETSEEPRGILGRSAWIKWTLIPLVVAVLAIAGVRYWSYSSVHESTDDAEIDGHLHPVSARVGGTALKVLVRDNQYVEAGAVLVEIDPKDYQVALDRARADLAEMEATLHVNQTEVPIVTITTSSQLSGTEASVGEASASVAAAQNQVAAARDRLSTAQAKVREAQANDLRAAQDLERMKALVAKEEVSRQQYDLAVAAAGSYHAQVESAESQVREAEQGVRVAESQVAQQQARLAEAQTTVASARTAPQQVAVTQARAESAAARVEQMRASVEQAQLNLEYTTVRAPASGIVSQRSVEVGQVVQAGQPLLAVIPLDLDNIWVTANFKETQLKNMRPGQGVTISVDTYGSREYRGHVDSVAAVTGARSSLLPPENATGNFVKVVKRIPVKIVFEQGQDPEHLLRPGMSAVPTVLTK